MPCQPQGRHLVGQQLTHSTRSAHHRPIQRICQTLQPGIGSSVGFRLNDLYIGREGGGVLWCLKIVGLWTAAVKGGGRRAASHRSVAKSNFGILCHTNNLQMSNFQPDEERSTKIWVFSIQTPSQMAE